MDNVIVLVSKKTFTLKTINEYKNSKVVHYIIIIHH